MARIDLFRRDRQGMDLPINNIWTVASEADLLPQWQVDDLGRADQIDIMSHYHRLAVQDFQHAIMEDRPPMVPGEDGRVTVAIFDAVYRSGRERRVVGWRRREFADSTLSDCRKITYG